MIARLRQEHGEMSLTGLLVACALFIVVLTATLDTYDSYARGQDEAGDRIDAQDRARTALEDLAKELRNLASPTPEQPEAFDAAGPYDIVFKTVDGNGPNAGANATNVKRMRYCLPGGSSGKLYVQTQTWTTAAPPAPPSTAACPGSGWNSTAIVASQLVNRWGGQGREVFAFNAAQLTSISAIRTTLYVDVEPQAEPRETTLSTGVFLRNQNREPTAAFTATATAQGILLNGSTSADPEGEPLSYTWLDDGVEVGTGIVFTLPAAAGTTHQLQLRVADPAGLLSTSAVQVVTA